MFDYPQRKMDKVISCSNNNKYNGLAMLTGEINKIVVLDIDNINKKKSLPTTDMDIWMAENNIDWVLASGKTPKRNNQYKFQYREVEIDDNSNKVSMVVFK